MPRKLSETLLDFASPLLGALPPRADADALRHALAMAIAAWNAVTLDQWRPGSTEAEWTRAFLKDADEPERTALLAVFDRLVARKHSDFAGERQAVGKWEVLRAKDGTFDLAAEGYLPFGLIPGAKR